MIVRKERPHPGAQLRFTDAYGMRLTCLATNTQHTPIAELELWHRQSARVEDRIRAARDTGLRNLMGHEAVACPRATKRPVYQVWLEIVQIALDLLAWMPMRFASASRRSATASSWKSPTRGPGFTAEQSSRIFEGFYRADTSRNRATGGPGQASPSSTPSSPPTWGCQGRRTRNPAVLERRRWQGVLGL
ncbi:hypothetical protein SGFS_021890 [Streptomyces graminofaciens]|uniref:Transposase n=1 Tax=Streptomyces graminofaciens TaxID=68212 RepID=A0ABM7F4U2_9ACTN|nr:hypothetical protein SGFS_021890 [Streptomyces graminofaciens]